MVNRSVEIIRKWETENQPPRMPKYSPKRYSVGVDLGQANDPTAIAVLEKTIAPPETAMFSPVGESPSNRLVEGSIVYDLVYLKRPKLGTAYDVIARRVAALICKLEPQGAFGELGQVTLCVDGTGVGRGVVDMIRAEFQRRGGDVKLGPKGGLQARLNHRLEHILEETRAYERLLVRAEEGFNLPCRGRLPAVQDTYR